LAAFFRKIGLSQARSGEKHCVGCAMITSRRKLAQVLDNRITQTRMNDHFNEPSVDHGPAMPDRRKFL